jgi:hypothetical protein
LGLLWIGLASKWIECLWRSVRKKIQETRYSRSSSQHEQRNPFLLTKRRIHGSCIHIKQTQKRPSLPSSCSYWWMSLDE